MALNTLELTTINRGIALCKKIVDEIEPEVQQLNIAYDAAGGVKVTVDQADLNTAPQLSGLTKTELDDGMFALTATLKGVIDTAYTQMSILAQRS